MGDASDKWKDKYEEVREANKVLLGMEVDFSCRLNAMENAGASIAYANGGAIAALFDHSKAAAPVQVREAFFKVVMPEEFARRLPWEVRILATGSTGERMIAGLRHYGENQIDSLFQGKIAGVEPQMHETLTKEKRSTNILKVRFVASQYKQVKAIVKVFGKPSSEYRNEFPIIDELLIG